MTWRQNDKRLGERVEIWRYDVGLELGWKDCQLGTSGGVVGLPAARHSCSYRLHLCSGTIVCMYRRLGTNDIVLL